MRGEEYGGGGGVIYQTKSTENQGPRGIQKAKLLRMSRNTFGFGSFEIRQNFENWKLFVTVYGQPNRRTDGNHSEQSSRSALKTARLITH